MWYYTQNFSNSSKMCESCYELVLNKCLEIHVFVKRIQTMEVVRIARIVPMGMERWASFRSPDRLDPAMIPKKEKKNLYNYCNFRKIGFI